MIKRREKAQSLVSGPVASAPHALGRQGRTQSLRRRGKPSSLFPMPSHLLYQAADDPQIKRVRSFTELIGTQFVDGVNAICWERTLAGDFEEIVERLAPREGIHPVDVTDLRALELSAAGCRARDVLIEDLELLRGAGLAPSLDCILAYPRDDAPGGLSTDVYSFHADSATAPADTYLCSYTESASEGLRNEEALQRIRIPETRAALLQQFGGEDNEAFCEYLAENCYALHYVPLPGARPFSFGLGNLWRIAVDYPGSPVPPCIHRAPMTGPGRPPRLLLIS